jgi:hypothetical protein
VSQENLPAVQDIGEGNAAVVLPLLEGLKVVNEDDEVVRATLVEDFGSSFVSTSHVEGFESCEYLFLGMVVEM